MMEPSHDKNGVLLHITPGQQKLARKYAKIRCSGHDHCRKRCEDLGSPEKNYWAEYWGVLAEIIIHDALVQRGDRPRFTFVSDHAPTGPDWVSDRQTFDIKACPPGKRFLCINEEAHLDPEKQPDFYLPVLFLTPTCAAIGAPIPAAEVTSTWRRMTNGHSPYYSTHRNTIKPLRSLEALPSPCEQERDPFTA